MKQQLLKFLQDSQGVNSSKRLAGLSGWAIFLILGITGGTYLLITNDIPSFISVLNSIGMTSCGAFGVSTFDHFKKNFVKKTNSEPEKQSTN